MKKIFLFLVLIYQTGIANDFLRNLPDVKLISAITEDRFVGMDAVIILKEQSFTIKNSSTFYRGVDIKGFNTIQTNILIVKVFNEAGINRYGSFEYEYNEFLGNEIRAGSFAKARVLKPDGNIIEMDESDVKIIVSRENNRGIPTHRKILFKIPSVHKNDVIQIEWSVNKPFVMSYSGQFYYNARDLILFSNLYITLPYKFNANYISFPEDRIGQPKIEQIAQNFGAGKTYFWSVKNLNPLPDEPFSKPFTDRSLLTAFYSLDGPYSTWENIANNYTNSYIDGEISRASFIKSLDIFNILNENSPSFKEIDSLYFIMREKFKLSDNNVVYTSEKSTEKLVESGKGDATDCTFLMYQILKLKKIPVNIVLIRDKREGIYEELVPSIGWFNRIGLSVNAGESYKIYDFDKSIPYQYDIPWYLNSTKIAEIRGEKIIHRIITEETKNKNIIDEHHSLSFDSLFNLTDSISVSLSGGPAEVMRFDWYDIDSEQIKENLFSKYNLYCLQNYNSAIITDYLRFQDIKYSIIGKTKNQSELYDDFFTINLFNHEIQDLRNKIYSTVRFSSLINFESFSININWEVDIPQSYEISFENLKNSEIKGPLDCSSVISYSLINRKLLIKTKIFIPKEEIPVHLFNNFIGFLDNIIEELKTNIIFKKI
jgi:hypothetical protein